MSREVPPAGDPLGRVWTDDELADRVLSSAPPLDDGLFVVEPSVGEGAFIRAVRRRWPWPSVYTLGVDIDPQAGGLALCDRAIRADWLTVAWNWGRLNLPPPGLFVGNLPWANGTVALQHAHAALDLEPTVGAAFVLPLPYVCGAEWDPLWRRHRPSVIRRIPYRPWPDRMREVCVFEWWRDGPGWRSPTEVLDLMEVPCRS